MLLVMLNSSSIIRLRTEKINLPMGEWLKDVLEKVHIIVERLYLQVSQDDTREILAELVRVNLCQFGSAEGARMALKRLMLVFHRVSFLHFLKVGLVTSGDRQCFRLLSPDCPHRMHTSLGTDLKTTAARNENV